MLWLFLSGPISHGVLWVLTHLYSALHEWFGSVFPLYSPISNAERYRVFREVLSFISFGIALFISTYLSVRLDNYKNERIISATDGLYTVGEAMPIYLRTLYPHDLIGSALAPVPIYLASALSPQWFFDKDFSFPLTHSRLLCESVGLFGAWLITALALALFHLLSALIALDRWRARWLTDFTA